MDGFSCKSGTSHFGVGLSNELGRFIAMDFAPVEMRKNAKNTMKIVQNALKECIEDEEEMKAKVKAIMSDSDHTQRSANKMIINTIFDGRHIVEFPCSLHGASGLEKRTFECLQPEVKEILHQVKILFGSRLNSGFRRYSLKAKLQVLVGKPRRNDPAVFQTDRGSRVHTLVHNAKALISEEHNVRLCTEFGSTNKNCHAAQLKKLMDRKDWKVIRGQLAFLALMWRSVAKPMFLSLSRPQTRKT